MLKGVVSVAIDHRQSSRHVASSSCTLALGNKEARVFGNSRAQSLLSAREEILQQKGMEKSPVLYTLMPLGGRFTYEEGENIGLEYQARREHSDGGDDGGDGGPPHRLARLVRLARWLCTTVASFLATQSVVFSIDKCKTVDSMIMSAHFRKCAVVHPQHRNPNTV
jgi:hypothetical protein